MSVHPTSGDSAPDIGVQRTRHRTRAHPTIGTRNRQNRRKIPEQKKSAGCEPKTSIIVHHLLLSDLPFSVSQILVSFSSLCFWIPVRNPFSDGFGYLGSVTSFAAAEPGIESLTYTQISLGLSRICLNLSKGNSWYRFQCIASSNLGLI
ncbi:hypothetical protein Dimus_004907 [Dionaea muscipula]